MSHKDKSAHHWILETPDGPTIRGECKICGAVRMFHTAPDDTTAYGRKLRKRPMPSKAEVGG